jgi:hypothetical protein
VNFGDATVISTGDNVDRAGNTVLTVSVLVHLISQVIMAALELNIICAFQ